MGLLLYVDNSNTWIEGKRVSAVSKGMALSIYDAMNARIVDNDYRIDFGKLYILLAGSETPKVAELFGSRPPENDSIWDTARRVGFTVRLTDRNYANKEKKVDTGIVARMMKDAYKTCNKDEDTIILVAGDKDFVPAVEELLNDGFKVKIAFWNHAAGELHSSGASFINLDPHLSSLKY
jgi:uncharacterized LabA/DUF88 family protein